MDKKKVLSMIGLATKAGKTKRGEFAVIDAIKNNHAEMVFVSDEASENTKKMYTDKCRTYGVYVSVGFTKEELGACAGADIVTAVAITDSGFAGALKKLLQL